MEEGEKRELQQPFNAAISTDVAGAYEPRLDLSLSMSIIASQLTDSNKADSNLKIVPVPKEEAGKQIQLAALEKASAERMRELARRELEQAEEEFRLARMIWEHAREELKKVESMKMIATRRIGSTCIEITCQNCHQHFQP